MDDLVSLLRAVNTKERPYANVEVCALCHQAADMIERMTMDRAVLLLYERFSNSVIRGQVLDAIAHKQKTGRYPFEDE